jgi:hypothetical protein
MFTKQDTIERTYAFLHKSLRPDEIILWSGQGIAKRFVWWKVFLICWAWYVIILSGFFLLTGFEKKEFEAISILLFLVVALLILLEARYRKQKRFSTVYAISNQRIISAFRSVLDSIDIEEIDNIQRIAYSDGSGDIRFHNYNTYLQLDGTFAPSILRFERINAYVEMLYHLRNAFQFHPTASRLLKSLPDPNYVNEQVLNETWPDLIKPLEQKLAQELHRYERVLWYSMPLAKAYAWGSKIVGIVCFLLFLQITYLLTLTDLVQFELIHFLSPIPVALLYGIFYPWRKTLEAQRTVYVITDQRVLSIVGERSDYSRITVFLPHHLQEAEHSRNVNSDGTGDIVLLQYHYRDSDNDPREDFLRLIAIPHVKQADEILQAMVATHQVAKGEAEDE